MAEEYNGICPPNNDIISHFKGLIDEDNAAKTELFLNNLKKNFLSNYLFERNSSLGYACENEKFNAALKLIEIGLREPEEVDLGEADTYGRTPLIFCCSSEDEMAVVVVKELLKGDCKPRATYGDQKSALMRACDYKEDASLLILNELLEFDYNLGFQVDNREESGLIYLFDYRSNQDKQFFLHNKLYIKVAVKYLKLYYIKNPEDNNFKQIMNLICNDAEVRKAFSSPLLKVSIPGSKQGIDLNTYCLAPMPATEFAIAPPVASIESVPKTRRRLELDIPEAEELPVGVEIHERRVSPGGRWVSEEQAQRYVRLYPPGKGPNDGPGGGPAGGKKRNTIKKNKKSKLNKKTRRQRR